MELWVEIGLAYIRRQVELYADLAQGLSMTYIYLPEERFTASRRGSSPVLRSLRPRPRRSEASAEAPSGEVTGGRR